jgi:hypothetical protein
MTFSLLPANSASLPVLATAGDLVGNGDPSLVGEGLAPPADLDGVDIADPDDDTIPDGTEPADDADPAETGETGLDDADADPDDDGDATETAPDDADNTGADTETGLVGEGLAPPADDDTDTEETTAPLEVSVSAAPSAPNDDDERLAKFLDPDAIVAINPDDPAEADKEWTAISDLDGLKAIFTGEGERGNYYLTADIDMGGADWKDYFATGWYYPQFYGTLDGQGYAIKNYKISKAYYYDYEAEDFTEVLTGGYGLFSYIDGATIRNLGLEGVEVAVDLSEGDGRSSYAVGALVGDADRSVIENCYVEGSVAVSPVSPSAAPVHVGGLVGSAAASDIRACRNAATVSADTERQAYAGGICGYSRSLYDEETDETRPTTVTGCLNEGAVSASASTGADAGGIIGEARESAIDNCTNEGAATATANSGEANAGGICGNTSFGVIIKNCRNTSTGTVTATSAAVGDSHAGGISGRLYEGTITNCTNEGAVSASITGVKLAENLSRGAYAGGIAGHSYSYDTTVSDCTNKGAVSATAAIGSAYAGGIAGRFGDSEPIKDCTNEGAVTAALTGTSASENYSDSLYAGGIVAYIYRSGITGCTNKGAVTATNSATVSGEKIIITAVGGIVGYTNQDVAIRNCTNESTATVTATLTGTPPAGNERQAYAGGIAGETQTHTVVEDCSNAGTVALNAAFGEHYANDAGAGGVIGYASNTTVDACANTGAVSASGDGRGRGISAGGIAGDASGSTLSACENEGTVTATATDDYNSASAGGIVGYASGSTISKCTNKGAIGSALAGGIVGGASGSTVSECANKGAVSATAAIGSAYAGGIAGSFGDGEPIENCTNEGAVTATLTGTSASENYSAGVYAGGIVGNIYRSGVADCTNKGSVTATNSATVEGHKLTVTCAGGIVGYANENVAIRDCENESAAAVTATLTGTPPAGNERRAYAGGIAGETQNSTDIENCSNAGAVALNAAFGEHYANDANAGGVVGYAGSGTTVKVCANTGNVTVTATAPGGGSVEAGGICGEAQNTTVSNCYNTGAMSASAAGATDNWLSAHAGGIIGYAYDTTALTCYSVGAVSAAYTGGNGDAQASGIIGAAYSSASRNCYWNSDSPQTVNGSARSNADKLGVGAPAAKTGALTGDQMKAAASFAGFDFTRTWAFVDSPSILNSGYPVLRALNEVTDIESISINKPSTTLAVGATETLTVAFTPAESSYRGVVWEAANPNVATVSPNGLVTAKASGMTMVIARSVLTPTISAICWVTVSGAEPTPAGDKATPKLPVSAITLNSKSSLGTLFTILPSDSSDAVFDDVRIASAKNAKKDEVGSSFSLKKEGESLTQYRLTAASATLPNGKYTLTLQASKDGADLEGGTATLTVTVTDAIPKATVKMPSLNTFWQGGAGKGAEGAIAISGQNLPAITEVRLLDSPKASEGKVTDNFKVEKNGAGNWVITALNTNGGEFGSGGFKSYTDSKKTKPAVKGRLEITFEGFTEKPLVNITVARKDSAPKLTFTPASQTIDLRQENIKADIAVTASDGSSLHTTDDRQSGTANDVVSQLWTDSKLNIITVELNDKAKASNKLSLDVWLAGAAKAITIAPTLKTIAVTATTAIAPSLAPASLTFNNNISEWLDVSVVTNAANVPAGRIVGITEPEDKGVVTNQWGSYGGLRIWPESAYFASNDRKTFQITANPGTKPGNYTYNVYREGAPDTPLTLKVKVVNKRLSASAKAVGKGNIDLLNRAGTGREFAVALKGTSQPVTGVQLLPSAKRDNEADYLNFYIDMEEWSNNNRLVVRAYEGAELRRGASYRIRLNVMASGGARVTSDITLKPAQSTPKHSFAPIAFFQSRTGMNSHQVIDVAPTAPAGARVASFSLANNPGSAYGSYYDSSQQQLHIWLADGSKVNPGKTNLTFNAIYEGQGFEGSGQWKGACKPRSVKLAVTIGR